VALEQKIKKTSVVSGVCDGFVVTTLIEQYGRQGGFAG
jgi:3-hydroxyacyl-CoA dehydrogenase